MAARRPGEAPAEITVGCCREVDPEALELEGMVGEERQATRKLLVPELRTKGRPSGRNSSPESCGGRSVELQIRATEEELGDDSRGKRQRSLRGDEWSKKMEVTKAGTMASRRP